MNSITIETYYLLKLYRNIQQPTNKSNLKSTATTIVYVELVRTYCSAIN